MLSTQLKNISQIGSFPQVGVKIKNVWNHHPEKIHLRTWGVNSCEFLTKQQPNGWFPAFKLSFHQAIFPTTWAWKYHVFYP